MVVFVSGLKGRIRWLQDTTGFRNEEGHYVDYKDIPVGHIIDIDNYLYYEDRIWIIPAAVKGYLVGVEEYGNKAEVTQIFPPTLLRDNPDITTFRDERNRIVTNNTGLVLDPMIACFCYVVNKTKGYQAYGCRPWESIPPLKRSTLTFRGTNYPIGKKLVDFIDRERIGTEKAPVWYRVWEIGVKERRYNGHKWQNWTVGRSEMDITTYIPPGEMLRGFIENIAKSSANRANGFKLQMEGSSWSID